MSEPQLTKFLEAIKSKESSGNYQAKNPKSSASGAYQFIDATWRSLTGRSDTARDATPEEQDQVARRYATHLLNKYKNDCHKAARAWEQGEPKTEKDPDAGKPYADDVMKRMANIK